MGVDGASARAEVYVKYAADLTRFATALVGPWEACDVVSAAMLRCLWSKRWSSVQDQRAYLFRAVLNQARQSHRSAMRRAAREARAAAGGSVLPPEVHPEVLEAVARLSLRQRAVVVLSYWADLDPAGVAKLLGISQGSVRRHLARARARLRELLDD
jgi:RNA polymerase sigma factor (sigma-70 family)